MSIKQLLAKLKKLGVVPASDLKKSDLELLLKSEEAKASSAPVDNQPELSTEVDVNDPTNHQYDTLGRVAPTGGQRI